MLYFISKILSKASFYPASFLILTLFFMNFHTHGLISLARFPSVYQTTLINYAAKPFPLFPCFICMILAIVINVAKYCGFFIPKLPCSM